MFFDDFDKYLLTIRRHIEKTNSSESDEKIKSLGFNFISENSFHDIIKEFDKETLSDCLNRLMREKNISAPKLYEKIGVNASTINKLLAGSKDRAERETIYKIVIGLNLNENETNDLMKKAGFQFSEHLFLDQVILYCVIKNEQIITPAAVDTFLNRNGHKPLFYK